MYFDTDQAQIYRADFASLFYESLMYSYGVVPAIHRMHMHIAHTLKGTVAPD
jgi:hypothetical protein